MEYGAFVHKGEADWQFMEDLLARVRRDGLSGLDHDDIEHLAACHRRAVSDFAFARTCFPGTAAERRLRGFEEQVERLRKAWSLLVTREVDQGEVLASLEKTGDELEALLEVEIS